MSTSKKQRRKLVKEMLDAVEDGESYTILKDGLPAAMILPWADWQALQGSWLDLLKPMRQVDSEEMVEPATAEGHPDQHRDGLFRVARHRPPGVYADGQSGPRLMTPEEAAAHRQAQRDLARAVGVAPLPGEQVSIVTASGRNTERTHSISASATPVAGQSVSAQGGGGDAGVSARWTHTPEWVSDARRATLNGPVGQGVGASAGQGNLSASVVGRLTPEHIAVAAHPVDLANVDVAYPEPSETVVDQLTAQRSEPIQDRRLRAALRNEIEREVDDRVEQRQQNIGLDIVNAVRAQIEAEEAEPRHHQPRDNQPRDPVPAPPPPVTTSNEAVARIRARLTSDARRDIPEPSDLMADSLDLEEALEEEVADDDADW